ncbi:MAG: Lysylphosphatidylglycerol synthase region [Candidatus Hydrogenedentota bacterium]|jgi:uncharacterized membrane protein YbhN (UPF0104 family)
MMQRLRLVIVSLLACVTVFVAWRFLREDGIEALRAWRGNLGWVALAIAVNLIGVAMDALCWTWTYRRCGLAVRGRVGLALFASVYALQFLPAQTGRLVRPEAARRLGLGTLRRGIEAEASLVYLDLSAVALLIVSLALWQWHPAAGLAAGLTLATAALAAAGIVARLLPAWAAALRPSLFWSLPGALCLGLRVLDRCMIGTVMLVLLWPVAGPVAYARVALYALIGDSAGSASGMPGGLGVAEPVLGWLLQMAELPAAQIVIVVGLYRLITFWAMVPLGWAAWLYVQRLPTRSTPGGSDDYNRTKAAQGGPDDLEE